MKPARDTAERRPLILAACLCGALGIAAWAFYFAAFAATLGQDWTVFYNAARLYFEGNVASLYDGDRFTALLDARLGLPATGVHPWLYPPSFLLFLLPLGMLPFAGSLGVFLLLGLGVLLAAFWSLAARGWPRWFDLAALLLSPAAALTVCLGQNSFLTGGLLVGGFRLLARRPIIGGILLGLATYKPQLWLLVPVALIAGRCWTALASAIAAAMTVVAASIAVFGVAPWRQWIALISGAGDTYSRWTAVGEFKGQSIYACIAMLGASHALAGLMQALAAAAAVAAVWWVHRRTAETDLRLIVLLAATTLATPHFMAYDALLLVIAATLLFQRSLADGCRPREVTIAMLLWLSTAFPPVLFRIGFAGPILTALAVAAVLQRVGYSSRTWMSSPTTRTL